ncbi:replication-associated protein [Delphin virus 3]|nr:replication-associated protein [Delphin virus 3]
MTKRIRRWSLTLNNPTAEEWKAVRTIPLGNVTRAIFANETGEEGTPHIQGFIHFKNAKSLTATKKFLGSNRWHLEISRGTDFENWTYCTKQDENAVMFGDEPIEGDDLSVWARIVQHIDDGMTTNEIIRRYPETAMRCITAIEKYRLDVDRQNAGWRDVETTYIHGSTGCGKTRYVMEKYGYKNVYRATDKKNPFDMYAGQDVIIFEEFRSTYKIEDMLNWLDGYPIELPARYANKMAKFTKVYLLSNWTFYEQYERVQEQYSSTWDAFVRRIDHLWDESELKDAIARDEEE